MKGVNIWKLQNLLNCCMSNSTEIDGKWVPARPIGWQGWRRFKAAWLVFTGKADAVIWPKGQ